MRVSLRRKRSNNVADSFHDAAFEDRNEVLGVMAEGEESVLYERECEEDPAEEGNDEAGRVAG